MLTEVIRVATEKTQLKGVAAGHLYAALMDKMSLTTFNKAIAALQELGVVKREHNLLSYLPQGQDHPTLSGSITDTSMSDTTLKNAPPVKGKTPTAAAGKTAAPPPVPKTPKAPAAPKAVRPELEKANGFTKPKEGGKTRLVWDIADKEAAKAGSTDVRKEVLAACAAKGVANGTAVTQYSRWRRFQGLQGRTPRPEAPPAAPKAPKVPKAPPVPKAAVAPKAPKAPKVPTAAK